MFLTLILLLVAFHLILLKDRRAAQFFRMVLMASLFNNKVFVLFSFPSEKKKTKKASRLSVLQLVYHLYVYKPFIIYENIYVLHFPIENIL